jgi:pimeloyl-ACP methyl ester carboxylesterase
MSQETQERGRLNNTPPLGKLYDISGSRRLMLHHAGSGTPAVVIEAGAGAFGLDYYTLFELCAQHTTCVLYDRAGSGWSDLVDGPRGAAEIVTDLHTALGLADVNGPYLLVGHSLGGLLVRAFTQNFPDDVIGLVLIDPSTEGIPLPQVGDEAIVKQMLEQLRANPDLARQWYPEMFADWEKLPAHVRDPLISRHIERADAGLRDMMSAARIQADVTNGPTLPDIPVMVLTGMKIDPTPGGSASDMESFNKIKCDAHRAFVNSLPHGEHRVLEDVGHRLTAERPDLVVNAIFEILDRVASR